MIATTIWFIVAGVAAVQADCGRCPLEPTYTTQERHQALAFNAMPKTWKTATLNDNHTNAFVLGRHGYGPWTCVNDCVRNNSSRSRTMCDYRACTKQKKHKVWTRYMYSNCANKYHDEENNKCIEPPQWDTSLEQMWCRTAHIVNGLTWGYTHFPICKATRQMCVYAKSK